MEQGKFSDDMDPQEMSQNLQLFRGPAWCGGLKILLKRVVKFAWKGFGAGMIPSLNKHYFDFYEGKINLFELVFRIYKNIRVPVLVPNGIKRSLEAQ